MQLLSAGLVSAGPDSSSSSQSPFFVPIAEGVEFTAILTVGDAVNGGTRANAYRMAGVPDGLGAFDNQDGTITVLMNHELANDKGVARMHGGASGAFVSRWKISKADLTVLQGDDLIRTVLLWDTINQVFKSDNAVVFNRFCSADLPAPSAFFDASSGLGYRAGRLFLNGEETTPEGRIFAHVASGKQAGTSYELPWLGKFAAENVVASPVAQAKTVVVAMDDQYNKALGQELGEVYVYVGTKQKHGTPVQQAGLAGGKLYGVKVDSPVTAEQPDSGFGAEPRYRFALVALGDVSTWSGETLQAQSSARGVSVFRRVEDGAWDTREPQRFYFNSTAHYDGNSRLWRLSFDDLTQPEQGGVIEMLLDGSEGQQMLDNLTIDASGFVYLQEDVGDHPRLGRIWRFDPSDNSITLLAEHDANRFLQGPTHFLTQDEESSGIIDVSTLFKGVKGYNTAKFNYFLLTSQAHQRLSTQDPALVENGQLLMMKVPRP